MKGIPLRKITLALATSLLSCFALTAPLAAPASAHSCQTTVTITHNRTETILTVKTNTCNRLVWPWGLFNNPTGPRQYDGVGVKHGTSVAYDPQSQGNVQGGWKWTNNGPINVITTY